MIKLLLKGGLALIIFFSNAYSQSQINKIVDISISPVSAFKEYCSRCHGEEGSSYGKGFGNLKDDSLKMVTEDMMFGPAGLNPDETEIEAMVSYNKSLKNNKPFATVLNAKSFLNGKDKCLEIETSPGAKLETNNNDIKINESRNVWKLSYDQNKISKVEIIVKRKNTSSMFTFPAELWTR